MRFLAKYHMLAAFLFMLVIEFCTYGSIVRQIGIYLDEWTSFYNLHFCPHTLWELMKCALADPRYVVRPVSVPYFASIYYFAHENPLVYHILNQACELAGAFFFYLALLPILRDKPLSFLVAILFLIYPSHDITHYSIGAATTPLAVTFYMFSFWLFVLAVERIAKDNITGAAKQVGGISWQALIGLSALFFLISLLAYEICLPLVIVFATSAAILLWNNHKPVKALTTAALCTIPALMAVSVTVFFRTVVLPWLKVGCGYRTIFDLSNMVHVVCEGIRVSISPYAFSFFWHMAQSYLSSGLNLGHAISLALVAAVLILASWIFGEERAQTYRLHSGILAVALGVVTIVSAYLIFGSSPDYVPVLDSHINRVNTASSMGAAMIIAGLIQCLSQLIKFPSQRLPSIMLIFMALPFIWLFMLADWQFAVPWIASWKEQKQIINILKSREISSGDTIILANVPRYIMWASVFDGVWDFQSALRISLNRKDINGGVLSDRMVLTPDALEDRFQTYLCARYPQKQLFVLVPDPLKWIAIHSKREFIDLAKQYGVIVPIDKKCETL